MKILVAMMASAFVLSAADAQVPSTPPSNSEAAPAAAAHRHGEEASELRRVDAHIKQLHGELEIATSEEPQWDNVGQPEKSR